jgi:hypothetical protein
MPMTGCFPDGQDLAETGKEGASSLLSQLTAQTMVV